MAFFVGINFDIGVHLWHTLHTPSWMLNIGFIERSLWIALSLHRLAHSKIEMEDRQFSHAYLLIDCLDRSTEAWLVQYGLER